MMLPSKTFMLIYTFIYFMEVYYILNDNLIFIPASSRVFNMLLSALEIFVTAGFSRSGGGSEKWWKESKSFGVKHNWPWILVL